MKRIIFVPLREYRVSKAWREVINVNLRYRNTTNNPDLRRVRQGKLIKAIDNYNKICKADDVVKSLNDVRLLPN